VSSVNILNCFPILDILCKYFYQNFILICIEENVILGEIFNSKTGFYTVYKPKHWGLWTSRELTMQQTQESPSVTKGNQEDIPACSKIAAANLPQPKPSFINMWRHKRSSDTALAENLYCTVQCFTETSTLKCKKTILK